MTQLEVSIHRLLSERKFIRRCVNLYELPLPSNRDKSIDHSIRFKIPTLNTVIPYLDNAIDDVTLLDTHKRAVSVRREAWRLKSALDEEEVAMRSQTLPAVCHSQIFLPVLPYSLFHLADNYGSIYRVFLSCI